MRLGFAMPVCTHGAGALSIRGTACSAPCARLTAPCHRPPARSVTNLLAPHALPAPREPKHRKKQKRGAADGGEADAAAGGIEEPAAGVGPGSAADAVAAASAAAAGEFIPATKWQGRKPGFAFKLGRLGLGYYPDHGLSGTKAAGATAAAAVAAAAGGEAAGTAADAAGAAAGQQQQQAGWVPMKTVADLRRALGIGAPRNSGARNATLGACFCRASARQNSAFSAWELSPLASPLALLSGSSLRPLGPPPPGLPPQTRCTAPSSAPPASSTRSRSPSRCRWGEAGLAGSLLPGCSVGLEAHMPGRQPACCPRALLRCTAAPAASLYHPPTPPCPPPPPHPPTHPPCPGRAALQDQAQGGGEAQAQDAGAEAGGGAGAGGAKEGVAHLAGEAPARGGGVGGVGVGVGGV